MGLVHIFIMFLTEDIIHLSHLSKSNIQ